MAFLPDLWVPMMMENHLFPSGRDNNNLGATARLRPGITVARVTAALGALELRIDEERGRTGRSWRFVTVSYDDMSLSPQIDGPITAMATMLLSAVGLVLLITCSNLATFLLASPGVTLTTDDDPYARVRGMTISCHGAGRIWGSDAMVETMGELRELGVNWITIHPYAGINRDGTGGSSRMDSM